MGAEKKTEKKSTLERDNPKPLYLQLKEVLLDAIESGKWRVNEKIPSENKLSEQYGLSRMTVRAVLTDLVKEGMLYRVQGKGTFVAEKISTVSPSYVGIREQLEKQGYEVETLVLGCEVCKSNAAVARHMQIENGAEVFKIRRLRSVKGEPISIHTSYIDPSYSEEFTKELLEKEQLCVLLSERYGVDKKRAEETLEAVPAEDGDAKLLGIAPGTPVLLLGDVLYAKEDAKPYEYTRIVFRGDKIKIHLRYDA